MTRTSMAGRLARQHNIRYSFAAVLAVFCALTGSPGLALGENDAQRINLAGRERMLLQRMARSACFIVAGVHRTENLSIMKQARDLFDTTLMGLIKGAPALGLEPESDAAAKAGLGRIVDLWSGFGASVSAFIDATTEQERARHHEAILSGDLDLLLEIDTTVGLMEQARSTAGRLHPAIANAVNIAGRQRMLSQKMTKEYCLLALGYQVELNRPLLLGTLALFESAQAELLADAAHIPISATVRARLEKQFTVIDETWQPIRAMLSAASRGGVVASDDLAPIWPASEILLSQLDEVVVLYESASNPTN